MRNSTEFREIFVKAVCARGEQRWDATHTLRAEHTPDEVLGCRLTNHRFTADYVPDDLVHISGEYTLHIWYSYGNHDHTDVLIHTVPYQLDITVRHIDHELGTSEPEVLVEEISPPTGVDAMIGEHNECVAKVEGHFLANVIAATKLCIKAHPGMCDLELLSGKKGKKGDWVADDETDLVEADDDDDDDSDLSEDYDDDPMPSHAPVASAVRPTIEL